MDAKSSRRRRACCKVVSSASLSKPGGVQEKTKRSAFANMEQGRELMSIYLHRLTVPLLRRRLCEIREDDERSLIKSSQRKPDLILSILDAIWNENCCGEIDLSHIWSWLEFEPTSHLMHFCKKERLEITSNRKQLEEIVQHRLSHEIDCEIDSLSLQPSNPIFACDEETKFYTQIFGRLDMMQLQNMFDELLGKENPLLQGQQRMWREKLVEQLVMYWKTNKGVHRKENEEELCVICASMRVDRVILPCRHAVCSGCVVEMTKARSRTCPFCRTKVCVYAPLLLEVSQIKSVD